MIDSFVTAMIWIGFLTACAMTVGLIAVLVDVLLQRYRAADRKNERLVELTIGRWDGENWVSLESQKFISTVGEIGKVWRYACRLAKRRKRKEGEWHG